MTSYSKALLHISPPIYDTRELQTLLLYSLRSLFGDCQSYSEGMNVLQCRRRTSEVPRTNTSTHSRDGNSDSESEAIIQFPTNILKYIRAACSCVSPPPFLDDTIYRIDFVKCDEC
mmetsp:Transcript_10280/g.13013  ORF Transcript_10280/g.13013 Transcript_10280/m.13013 type:complete len:116 (+) Transcript_10280:82-429(+)